MTQYPLPTPYELATLCCRMGPIPGSIAAPKAALRLWETCHAELTSRQIEADKAQEELMQDLAYSDPVKAVNPAPVREPEP